MTFTPSELRAVLIHRSSSHTRQEEDLRAAAHEHKGLADKCRRELELLDTPELPNLFTSCPICPTSPNLHSTEFRPNAS